MKKQNYLFGLVLLMATFAIIASSCGKGKQKKQPEIVKVTTIDESDEIVKADRLLANHKSDIRALWDDEHENVEIAKYAIVDSMIYLASADEKQGLLLYFFVNGRNTDDFDGLSKDLNKEITLFGRGIKVVEKDDDGTTTTYYRRNIGFEEVVEIDERNGNTEYEDGNDLPISAEEAKTLITKLSNGREAPIQEMLGKWNEL